MMLEKSYVFGDGHFVCSFCFFLPHLFAAGSRSWTVVLGSLQAKATKGLLYWSVSRQRSDGFTGQSPG